MRAFWCKTGQSFSFLEEVVGSPSVLRYFYGRQQWGAPGAGGGCQEEETMDVVGVLEQTAAAAAAGIRVRWEAVAFVGRLVTWIGPLLEAAECPLLQGGWVVIVTLTVWGCLTSRALEEVDESGCCSEAPVPLPLLHKASK